MIFVSEAIERANSLTYLSISSALVILRSIANCIA